MTVRDYSTTPASNNAAPPNGWPEGQAASTVNDCGRQMMAEIRETCEDFPYFDWGDDPTRVDNDTFTLVGDLTARYPVGARIKLVGATTGFARISASAFGAVTTIDVVMDSGNVPTSLVRVAVQPSSGSSETPTSVSLTASAAGTSVGLSRADHIHALSQSIAPTMTGTWTFTASGFTDTTAAVVLSSASPFMMWKETDAAANNGRWRAYASGEQFVLDILNDAQNSAGTIMTVDRTGTMVDRVALPADTASGNTLVVGPVGSLSPASQFRSANRTALSASTTSGVASTVAAVFVHNENTSGDNAFISFSTESGSGTVRGSIDFNRAATQVRYNVTCDRDLKMSIADAGSAVAALMSIPVRSYRWKETGYLISFGFVAQEVEPVFPEAVSPGGEGRAWGMDYSKMVPVLTKALQEVAQMCQSLTARVAALEGGVSEIKPR